MVDINIDEKLIFAHEVMFSSFINVEKTKKGNFKKEAFVELIFIDVIRKKAVSRVTLPMSVLKNVPKMIDEGLNKIKSELKSKDIPKQPKIETKSTNSSYLG